MSGHDAPLEGLEPAAAPEKAVGPPAGFVAGTMIRVVRDRDHVDVPVETLAVGDLVAGIGGDPRPIVRVIHRVGAPGDAAPVRFCAHAFATGVPARDLYVSPDKYVGINAIGQFLIAAGSLLNEATVAFAPGTAVDYWQVELDAPDILFAENTPIDSCRAVGDQAASAPPGDGCPRLDGGRIVEGIRAQLIVRMTKLGWHLEVAPRLNDLHLVVDGRRVEAQIRDLSARFTLPATAREVWLVCLAGTPAEIGMGTDLRRIGAYLRRVTIMDGFGEPRVTDADDPRFVHGFHPAETGAKRWTDGAARLPADLWTDVAGDDFYMRIDFAGMPIPRWHAPDQDALEQGALDQDAPTAAVAIP